jgi:membrane protein required for colicin V production
LNWIDIVLALVIASSVLAGLASGFARVGVGFAALIVGMFCGFWFYGVVGAYFMDYFKSHAVANLMGFFVILIVVLVLGAIIGRILAKFFKWAGLSWLDRLLGGAFGIVRGFVVAAAMVTVLLAFAPSPPPPSVVDSKLLPYVINVSGVLAAVTPREIKDSFYATKDKVKADWEAHNSRPPAELRHE